MGNCLFGGWLGESGDHDQAIKVITSNGGIMELYGPITAECITTGFPGQGIFRSSDLFWKPLAKQDELVAGESYYLLPVSSRGGEQDGVIGGHIRSSSIPNTNMSAFAPYRMSFDSQQFQFPGKLKRSYTDAFSRSSSLDNTTCSSSTSSSPSSGFWKVRLVITPRQLLDILSHEAQTQELIECVRTVAKCGHYGGGLLTPVVGFSDDWSLSSTSRNASSTKDD